MKLTRNTVEVWSASSARALETSAVFRSNLVAVNSTLVGVFLSASAVEALYNSAAVFRFSFVASSFCSYEGLVGDVGGGVQGIFVSI